MLEKNASIKYESLPNDFRFLLSYSYKSCMFFNLIATHFLVRKLDIL